MTVAWKPKLPIELAVIGVIDSVDCPPGVK